MDERRTVLHGILGHHDTGEIAILYIHEVRRVACLVLALGDHDGHALAHESHTVHRHRHVEGAMSRRAAHVFRHNTACRAHAVRDIVLAGQYRHDTRCGFRSRGVDGLDVSVCRVRIDKHRIGLTRQHHVGHIAPAAP